jgi:hypothetical protein
VHHAGRAKCGFFPLPSAEARRLRNLLRFPEAEFSALDPCVGDGVAFSVITSDSRARRYGIELDAYRAEQAREVLDTVIQGDCFDVHCPVESVSCLFENPPFDFELGEGQNLRAEYLFLEHTYRWLRPGGVLIFTLPGPQLPACARILASHFRDVCVYRLTEPECARYKQVILLGIRRNRRDRERLQDRQITEAELQYSGLRTRVAQLPPLPDHAEPRYALPESGPVQFVYRGLPLDEIEDALPRSAAYRQARRTLLAEQPSVVGRPLLPLHQGHVGLLAVAGLLDVCLGAGDDRHLAVWLSRKVVEHSEVVEDGTIILRDRERFAHELNLAFADGRVLTLSA